MKLRHVYFCLCIIGTVLPYSQFLPWLTTHGLDLSLFFHELFSTRISGFFVLDVIVSAIVLVIFMFSEGAQSQAALVSKQRWLYNNNTKPENEEDRLS